MKMGGSRVNTNRLYRGDEQKSTKAVIYARNSDAPGARESMSCDVQVQRCADWAFLRDMEVFASIRDHAVSGRKADRPGLAEALETVIRLKGVLVVYSLSRLSRSVVDAIAISQRLEEGGAGLASLTECIDTSSPTGRFFFTLMASLAELERETTAQRTRDALATRKAQGLKYNRTPPFGYRWERGADGVERMVEDPREIATVSLARELAAGGMTVAAIARELGRLGYTNRAGSTAWHRQSVSRMVCRGGIKFGS